MSLTDHSGIRAESDRLAVDLPHVRGRRHVVLESHAQPSTCDLRLSSGADEPGWNDDRIRRWITVFLSLGVAVRLLRFGLRFPLWNDEAYLALNILDRDFWGLTRPLDYAQVCPLFFLWAEKAIILAIGFSEYSLRLLPTIASIASLFLFRHVAGRLLRGQALVLAVAIMAIGYSPIRFGGEVKPYATDFLAALGLLALAIEWLRTPARTRFLWALAALGPLAIGLSNPAIFVAASIGLVLTIPVLYTRSFRATAALGLFGLLSVAMFLVLLHWVNGPQSDHVISWMRLYWAGAFPPRSPLRLLGWLVSVHTSHMFAYPAGGDHGLSTFTSILVATAIIAYLKRGPKLVLALFVVPFGLGLIAAALERYPYGGSARTMQYVAPGIIVMAGLGAAILLARLPWPKWRDHAPRWALAALVAIGLGIMTWDLAHPFKIPFFRGSRDLARRVWAKESAGAELLCAWTDLRLPLDRLRWEGDRAVMYRCHQAIYSPRHAAGKPPRLDLVSPTHPLRILVFNETPSESIMVARWITAKASGYTLRDKREYHLNMLLHRGKRVFTDHYVIYELIPRR